MGDFGPDWYINTVELVTSLTQVGKYLSGLEWSLSICNILRTISTKLIWVLEEGPKGTCRKPLRTKTFLYLQSEDRIERYSSFLYNYELEYGP